MEDAIFLVPLLLLGMSCPTSRAFWSPSQLYQQKSPLTPCTCLKMSAGQRENEGSRRTFFRQPLATALVIATGSLREPNCCASTTAEAAPVTSSVSTDPDPLIFELLPQFLTVDDVPKEYFHSQQYIYAFVERIVDGDTIRVRHIPGYGFGRKVPQPLDKRGIAEETLIIRIYGVDAPETAKKKGKESQPFGKEAEAFTKDLVYHKMVKITFLRKDQYKRAVAQVETVEDGIFARPKDLSMELAKAGLAEMYIGGGAVYFGRREDLEQAIANAKKEKRGIWSLEDRVSAAEYKRAMREGEGTPVATRAFPDENNVDSIHNRKEEETKPAFLACVYDMPTTTTTCRSPTKCQTLSAQSPFMNRNAMVTNLLDIVIAGLEIAPI